MVNLIYLSENRTKWGEIMAIYAQLGKRFIRIIFTMAMVAAIGGRSAYSIIKRDDLDFQSHPIASLLGGFLPAIIGGFLLYWWLTKMSAKNEQPKLAVVENLSAMPPVISRINRTTVGVLVAGVIVSVVAAIWVFAGATSSDIAKPAVVPNPAGFIEGSALSKNIKDWAVAGLSPNVKLIGMYYEPDTLSKILKIGYSEPAPFGKALVQFESKSTGEADRYLKNLVMNAKKEGSKSFDRNDPVIDRIVSNYEDAEKKINSNIAITANGVTLLGSIAETDTYYASSLITVFNWSDGTQTANLPFVSAVSWMRVGKQVIQLSMTYPFAGKQSILFANAALIAWVKEVEKSNP